MSPHLRKHPVDAVIARLAAAGDAQAAEALSALRDALAAQDEALRDLVCDANEVVESPDEGGGDFEIRGPLNGLDAFLGACGYGPERGRDPAEVERLRAAGEELDDFSGAVFLSPLDHLRARILTEGATPERNLADGAVAVEVTVRGGVETLYVEGKVPEPAPGPAP